MLYEVITDAIVPLDPSGSFEYGETARRLTLDEMQRIAPALGAGHLEQHHVPAVITSYSIHYTKLYEEIEAVTLVFLHIRDHEPEVRRNEALGRSPRASAIRISRRVRRGSPRSQLPNSISSYNFV